MPEISVNAYFAFIGLFMAILELYFPYLSIHLESLLLRIKLFLAKFVIVQQGENKPLIKYEPKFLKWLNEKGLTKIVFWSVGIFVWLTGVVLYIIDKNSLMMKIYLYSLLPIAYLYVITISIVLFLLPFYILFLSLYSTIRFLNYIGRGKAISGIGIILAIQGLLVEIL